MNFWIRKVILKAGDKEFYGEDFEIGFRVPFSTKEEPDISEVMITNLSDSSVASIKAKDYIILNAGYETSAGNILNGSLEEVSSKWEGTDKITTITVSDGGFEWRKSKVQKTYAKGTSSSYIMQDLAGILGLEIGEIAPKKQIVYKLGKTISGNVNKALKQLAKDTNSKMYISKGRLYIRDSKKGTKTGFLLKSDTGLIGSPEKIEEEDENGKKVIKYKVVSLLNYRINTDSLIEVRSRTINGNYRVESGEHTGDFLTEMIVVPV